MVSGPFNSPSGVLFIFRSRYFFTIGRQRVLSLRRWASWIQAGFHVTGPTRGISRSLISCRIRDCHPLWCCFPSTSSSRQICNSICEPHNPAGQADGLGYIPFRSPLLGKSLLLSLPMGTEMFQFPTFAPYAYVFSIRSFRDPGINARLTTSPGLSQPSTPFIAFWRQDIPHTPLCIWPH